MRTTKVQHNADGSEFGHLMAGGLMALGAEGIGNEFTLFTIFGEAEIAVDTEDGYNVRCQFEDAKAARQALNCNTEGEWNFCTHGNPRTQAGAILETLAAINAD